MKHDGPKTRLSQDDKQTIVRAFDSIKAKDSVKEHIFYEVQRNYENSGYVSKAKLRFAKHNFDRYVPAVAACVILICGLSFFGVSQGWFTGEPFKPTDQLLKENGVSYSEEASLPLTAAAPSEENASSEASTQEGSSTDEKSITAGNYTANSVETTDITIFAAKDIGYTQYKIYGIPKDGFILWDEMQVIGAAPTTFSLESYSFDDSDGSMTLVLNFDDGLQTFLDSSATTDVISGVVNSFSQLFTECTAIDVNSNGVPAVFGGNPLDTAAMMSAQFQITAAEEITYNE